MAETREIILNIDSDIDDELAEIARSMGRDKQSLAREALLEWLEDQEDIRDASAVIAKGDRAVPLRNVKEELGLER